MLLLRPSPPATLGYSLPVHQEQKVEADKLKLHRLQRFH